MPVNTRIDNSRINHSNLLVTVKCLTINFAFLSSDFVLILRASLGISFSTNFNQSYTAEYLSFRKSLRLEMLRWESNEILPSHAWRSCLSVRMTWRIVSSWFVCTWGYLRIIPHGSGFSKSKQRILVLEQVLVYGTIQGLQLYCEFTS